MSEKVYNPKYYPDSELRGKPGVYQIRNTVNNKLYIGSSKDLFNRKYNGHFKRLKKHTHPNEHLQKAYILYGEENFVFEIIEFCSLEQLLDKEQYWIDELNVLNRDYGYNIKPYTTSGKLTEESRHKISLKAKGRVVSEETKRKIGFLKRGNKNNLGKHLSSETKNKLSIAQKNRFKTPQDNPMFGRHHTESAKEKMRQARKKYVKENHPRRKEVIDLDTQNIYKTLTQCSEDVGISEITIIKHCKNRVKSIPQRFMYYKDYLPNGTIPYCD